MIWIELIFCWTWMCSAKGLKWSTITLCGHADNLGRHIAPAIGRQKWITPTSFHIKQLRAYTTYTRRTWRALQSDALRVFSLQKLGSGDPSPGPVLLWHGPTACILFKRAVWAKWKSTWGGETQPHILTTQSSLLFVSVSCCTFCFSACVAAFYLLVRVVEETLVWLQALC